MSDYTPAFPKDARPWHCRAENEGCSRTSPCNSCRGRRNRRSGLAKQRAARKALGVPRARVAAAESNEESWRGIFRWEIKSGQLARSAATRYLEAEKQAEANKAVGDTRPFAAGLMPHGWGSEGLVVVRLSVWKNHVGPALDAYWGES